MKYFLKIEELKMTNCKIDHKSGKHWLETNKLLIFILSCIFQKNIF